jgi:hypothetical protein
VKADANYKAKYTLRNHSPEHKARRKTRKYKAWMKAYYRAHCQTPEYKAQQKAYDKKREGTRGHTLAIDFWHK